MASSTEYITLRGKAKYARVYQPDKYGKYSLLLYLTPEDMDKFMSLKVKNNLKKDEEGYHVQLSRPASKEIRGKLVAFAPPEVVDVNGLPTQVLIGNGSDVEVKLEYYTYAFEGKEGRAIRLLALKIHTLIPYVPNRNFEEKTNTVIGVDPSPMPAKPVTKYWP